MKLIFSINQAECFRNGVNAEKSIVTVEVEPGKLTQHQRNLIADRMVGIKVFQKRRTTDVQAVAIYGEPCHVVRSGDLIVAKEPTLDSLISAVIEDEFACQQHDRTEVPI